MNFTCWSSKDNRFLSSFISVEAPWFDYSVHLSINVHLTSLQSSEFLIIICGVLIHYHMSQHSSFIWHKVLIGTYWKWISSVVAREILAHKSNSKCLILECYFHNLIKPSHVWDVYKIIPYMKCLYRILCIISH